MPPDLSAAPFRLDTAARDWVAATLSRLTPDQKLRQLFNLRIAGPEPEGIAAIRDFGPGGITWHPGRDAAAERGHIAALKAAALTPLLVSADLEGSRMSLPFGLEVPNPLALAAADDVAATEEIARLMAREAKSVGINWTLTPVLDINAAFRSAIVATRGFGSDVALIERHMLATLRGVSGRRRRGHAEALAGRGLRRPRPASGDDNQPAGGRGLGREFRAALPLGHRGGGDVGHVGAYRAARLCAGQGRGGGGGAVPPRLGLAPPE